MCIYSIRSGSCLLNAPLPWDAASAEIKESGRRLLIACYFRANQIWDPLLPDRLITESFSDWKIDTTVSPAILVAANAAETECLLWHMGYACGVRCDVPVKSRRNHKVWLYGTVFIADGGSDLYFIPIPPRHTSPIPQRLSARPRFRLCTLGACIVRDAPRSSFLRVQAVCCRQSFCATSTCGVLRKRECLNNA